MAAKRISNLAVKNSKFWYKTRCFSTSARDPLDFDFDTKLFSSHGVDDVRGEMEIMNLLKLPHKKGLKCLILSPTADLAFSLASFPNVQHIDCVSEREHEVWF